MSIISEKSSPLTTPRSGSRFASSTNRSLAMTLKTKLKALLQSANKEEKKFVNEFKTKEIGSAGKLDDWLVKDIIVHITYWNKYYVAKTLAMLRDEKPEPCNWHRTAA